MTVSSHHPPSPASAKASADSLPPEGGGSAAPLAYNPSFWQTRRTGADGRIVYGGRAYYIRARAHRLAELTIVQVNAHSLVYRLGRETYAAELVGA